LSRSLRVTIPLHARHLFIARSSLALSVALCNDAGETSILERWPPWWSWPLDFTHHLLKRMVDRRFSQVDLRAMLEDATSVQPDSVAGRFIVSSRHEECHWKIVVEPDHQEHRLVVVAACAVEGSGDEA
jgi:hypothetical protein